MSMTAERWQELVSDKPRLAAVLKAVQEGDNTFYLLVKRFHSPGVGKILQDLLALDAVAMDLEKGKTGLPKKAYRLTPLGKKLANG